MCCVLVLGLSVGLCVMVLGCMLVQGCVPLWSEVLMTVHVVWPWSLISSLFGAKVGFLFIFSGLA